MASVAQQAPPPVPAAQERQDSVPATPGIHETSPKGAFLRAVLLPGWGHASIGAYRRGTFYFVMETATAFSLARAIQHVHEAQGRVQFREDFLREKLAAEGVTDETEIQTALDDDETLQDLQALETARRQQREDWTSLGLFLVFLSGADAYVSTHLRHFPAPLEVNVAPVGDNGRMEVAVKVTLPR